MKKKQAVDCLALARRIRAADVSIYIEEDDENTLSTAPPGPIGYQEGAILESSAFDYPGGTGFTIQLAITCNVCDFAISQFGLEVPWPKTYFRWLDDPLEIDGVCQCYRFIGNPPLEFARSQVLNHRANVCQILPFGRSIKGFLLGTEMGSVPDEFRNGSQFQATVIVRDQFFREYRIPVFLAVNRAEKPRGTAQSRAHRRGGLLDRPDHTKR